MDLYCSHAAQVKALSEKIRNLPISSLLQICERMNYKEPLRKMIILEISGENQNECLEVLNVIQQMEKVQSIPINDIQEAIKIIQKHIGTGNYRLAVQLDCWREFEDHRTNFPNDCQLQTFKTLQDWFNKRENVSIPFLKKKLSEMGRNDIVDKINTYLQNR